MFKTLLSVSMIFTLAACSFDKNNSSNNDRQARQLEVDKARLAPVEGIYTGTFSNNSITQTVEVVIKIKEVAEGPEVNGQKSIIAVLKADYKKMSPVAPGYKFTVNYLEQTRSLQFTNEKKGDMQDPLSSDDIETISAQFYGDKIVGTASSKIGDIGQVVLTRKANESGNKPVEQNEQDYYDRLAKQYQSIAGVYEGKVVPNNGNPFPVTFEVAVQMIPQGKLSVPEFYGFYRRLDTNREGTSLRLENFQYQADLTPKRLVAYGVPLKFPGSPYKATFQGQLKDGHYIGSWSSNANGFEGSFDLKMRAKKAGEGEEDIGNDDEQCVESAAPAADWPTLPKEGPIPTPRPHCP